MDAPESLKKTNPQKYYIKIICNSMYILGFGNCWYEPHDRTAFHSWIYLSWGFLANFYIIAGIFNEFLGNFRSDLSDQERNDLVQFTVAHGSILAKIISSYIYRKDIKIALERLVERSSTFRSEELDKACVKRFVTLCSVIVSVSFVTLIAATAIGIKAYLTEEIPICTEVVYYPSPSASGLVVNIIRFFIVLHWFYTVAIMSAIDCLCITSLVIAAYKFKTTQAYFESLRKVLEKKRFREELKEQFRVDLVVGIVMHEDALWCAKNVQSALGNMYSIQVFESVALLVVSLLKLVHMERSLVFLLASFTYILGLILITGAYMMAGGDVSHEASEVSKSIFFSGWEFVGAGPQVRVLAVLALQRSQVPVYMCAFGIITLSYTNFISVIRSSYSYFAVMY